MKKKSYFKLLFIIVCALGLAACSNKQNSQVKGLNIVTSFYPIYAMVKEISGDLNNVRMIQSGAGIHEFEPSVTDVQAIYDADVFVYHSHTLENWASGLDPNEENSNVKIIEASAGMELDRVQGLEDVEVTDNIDPVTLYDPHTWLDPIKVSEEAQIIAKQLGEVDEKNAQFYQDNADKLSKEAQELADKYQPIFEKATQKTFVTQHTAFAYLAKRFGLKQLGIAGISPEQEPNPKQLSEIEDFVKEYGVTTIFTENNASSKVAETVASATGVTLKTLSPLESDPQNNLTFLENLENNLKILSEELK